MTLRDALSLGRVSNLPTIWSNMLAALVLAGGAFGDGRVPALLVGLTLFYVGGMYLNDGFDAEVDARERPTPAGRVALALWLIRRRGPGDIPRAVVNLIAGTGNLGLAGLALQRYVAGT